MGVVQYIHFQIAYVGQNISWLVNFKPNSAGKSIVAEISAECLILA